MNAPVPADLNPYASPVAPCRGGPEYWAADFTVQVVTRSWLLRKLSISGPCPCVVDYNGRGSGYETILVNGIVAARARGGFFSLAARLEFAVPGVFGRQRACFEVQTAWLLFLGGLRLSIGNQIVYSEGTW